MGKVIKLIAIFVAVVGIAVGALYLVVDPEPILGPPDPDVLQMCEKKIKDGWSKGEWKMDTYTNTKNYIVASKKKLGVSFETVIQNNQTCAAEVLNSVAMQEWSKSNCNEKRVRELNSDCANLKKDAGGNLNKNTDIANFEDTYRIYAQCLKLCRATFTITDEYGPELKIKERVETNRRSAIGRKNEVMNSLKFTNLKNITEISNGLSSIDAKVLMADTAFICRMAREIKDYYTDYEGSPESDDELNMLYYKSKKDLSDAISDIKDSKIKTLVNIAVSKHLLDTFLPSRKHRMGD